MSNIKIAYLSGAMSGVADHNFPAFNEAARVLRSDGWEVVNPAENFNGRTDLPRNEYMLHDIDQLVQVAKKGGAVIVLPGWEASKGAALEVACAREFGIRVLDLSLNPTPVVFETGEPEGILDEALRITSGIRQQNYGKPETNHNRIALLWAAWDICSWCGDEEIASALAALQEVDDLRCADRGVDVAMKMILLKIAREANAPKRDNLVDIAGYARVISRIHKYEE